MIGWGVENNTQYWLITNSWNESWGENGTFRIIRGTNHVGIEEEMLAALPKVQWNKSYQLRKAQEEGKLEKKVTQHIDFVSLLFYE